MATAEPASSPLTGANGANSENNGKSADRANCVNLKDHNTHTHRGKTTPFSAQFAAVPMHKNPTHRTSEPQEDWRCISVGGGEDEKGGNEEEGASCSVTAGLKAISFSLAVLEVYDYRFQKYFWPKKKVILEGRRARLATGFSRVGHNNMETSQTRYNESIRNSGRCLCYFDHHCVGMHYITHVFILLCPLCLSLNGSRVAL